MAYKHDKDLEFLRKMKDEELHTLVEILIRDKDGELRKAEELTSKEGYKRYGEQYGRYIEDILEELQTFGGDTLVNLFRGGGVLYREILNDVCKRCEVEVGQGESVEASEYRLTEKLLKDALDKADEATLRQVAEEMGYDFSKLKDLGGKLTSEVLLKFITGGNLSAYKISSIVANLALEQFLPKVAGAAGVSTLASFGLGRVVGFLNPLLAAGNVAWLTSEITGPAYRVTIPATLQVAHLRRRYLDKKEIDELNKMRESASDSEAMKKLSDFIAKTLKLKLNVLIVGATGVGKSSTIKAIFPNADVKIGTGVSPETQGITQYQVKENLILWDSPGFGEGKEKDRQHAELITQKLQEKDDKGDALIDMVLVILDATNKGIETESNLINFILQNAPDKRRVLVALNKCDKVISELEFHKNDYKPSQKQIEWLNEKVQDIKMRVAKDTGVDIDPIYYTAGFTEDAYSTPEHSYNLSELLYFIVDKTPAKKRIIYGGGVVEPKIEGRWWNLVIESAKKLYEGNKEVKEFIDSMIKKGVEKGKEIVFSWLKKLSK